jgi:phage terminase large subunit-like protein
VVVGRVGARAYVLADRTAQGLSPAGWAARVAETVECWRETADDYGCDVVAEANQGGAMVRSVLVGAGVSARVRLVHASEGKRARAEPVAALYEQGRVSHCGAYPALEEEMMALGAAEAQGRFDRADALVWGLTALMLEDRAGREGPRIRVLDGPPARRGWRW